MVYIVMLQDKYVLYYSIASKLISNCYNYMEVVKVVRFFVFTERNFFFFFIINISIYLKLSYEKLHTEIH